MGRKLNGADISGRRNLKRTWHHVNFLSHTANRKTDNRTSCCRDLRIQNICMVLWNTINNSGIQEKKLIKKLTYSPHGFKIFCLFPKLLKCLTKLMCQYICIKPKKKRTYAQKNTCERWRIPRLGQWPRGQTIDECPCWVRQSCGNPNFLHKIPGFLPH